MPHYKCGACRTRLQIVQPSPVLSVTVVCPQCRLALDPVTDLTELIGLRRVPFVEAPNRAGGFPGSLDEPESAAVALSRPSPIR